MTIAALGRQLASPRVVARRRQPAKTTTTTTTKTKTKTRSFAATTTRASSSSSSSSSSSDAAARAPFATTCASAALATAAALTLALSTPDASIAGTPKGQGVASGDAYGRTDVDRCSREALKKAANTRAAFSDFATQQNEELYVNVEGCDYSNMDLSDEVLSGVKARGANFENSIFGAESSRADFSDANLRGAVIRSVNLYNTIFAGADLEGADLSGSLAPGAFFGRDEQTGKKANLKDVNFEDTLLSSSDVRTICANSSLTFESKMSLGC